MGVRYNWSSSYLVHSSLGRIVFCAESCRARIMRNDRSSTRRGSKRRNASSTSSVSYKQSSRSRPATHHYHYFIRLDLVYFDKVVLLIVRITQVYDAHTALQLRGMTANRQQTFTLKTEEPCTLPQDDRSISSR